MLNRGQDNCDGGGGKLNTLYNSHNMGHQVAIEITLGKNIYMKSYLENTSRKWVFKNLLKNFDNKMITTKSN